MLFKGTVITQASGSVGGLVFSHNSGGAYIRARVTPTNPNSPEQIVVRNAVSFLSNFWNDGLTPAQRAVWDTYAANVTITNRIGDQVFISGMAHYVRSNVARLQADVLRVDAGPGIFNISTNTRPFINGFSFGSQTINFNFGNSPLADAWANEVGGFTFVYVSRPQNLTINYFRGPYRLTGTVVGDPVAPVAPLSIDLPFPVSEGQKIFARSISTRSDGRLASEVFMEMVAIS